MKTKLIRGESGAIGFISMGSSGTMGHMMLLTQIIKEILLLTNQKIYLFSEYPYKKYTNLRHERLVFIEIPKQRMRYSDAGAIDYKYKDILFDEIKKRNIKTVFYSTFFDIELLKLTKKEKIKSFLVSYPLRDTYTAYLFGKQYHRLFEKYIILKDIFDTPIPKSKNVIFVKPITSKQKSKEGKRILITIGGGGRPSAKIFLKLVTSAIRSISKKYAVKFTLIVGAYNKNKLSNLPNTRIKKWSKNIEKELNDSFLIISEAGFFSIYDFLSNRKPAILIPGFRTIDNQEYRAVKWELEGCGFCVLPRSQKNKLEATIEQILNNPQELERMKSNCTKLLNKINNLPDLAKTVVKLAK